MQFALALDVPFIRASLTDSEYALMTSVAASNVSETPRLPSGAQWVEDHHLTASSTPPTRPSQPPSTTSPSKQTHEAVQEGGGQSVEVALKDRSSIRVVVSLGELELELKRTVAGLQVPSPLARFSIAELNVAYRTTDAGAMFVETCIPKLEARDLRPEVPVEQSLVISSGHKASFCMLTVCLLFCMSSYFHSKPSLFASIPTLCPLSSLLSAVGCLSWDEAPVNGHHPAKASCGC